MLEPLAPGAGARARQAAALAATGFVGRRRDRRGREPPPRRGRAARRKRKKGVLGEIVSSNSFLVDVHLLRRD